MHVQSLLAKSLCFFTQPPACVFKMHTFILAKIFVCFVVCVFVSIGTCKCVCMCNTHPLLNLGYVMNTVTLPRLNTPSAGAYHWSHMFAKQNIDDRILHCL